MQNRETWALFICSLATWFVGVGIMPILPVYAGQLGASPTVTGNFLAVSFAFLALGTFLAGRIAALFKRRRGVIVAAGFVCLPATWAMGQVTHVGQLTALTALVWFSAGVALTLESVITGLVAAEVTRGRMFGLLAATASLAGLLGGFVVGPIIDQWGYSHMFAILSLAWVIQLVSGCFLPERPIPQTGNPEQESDSPRASIREWQTGATGAPSLDALGAPFMLLFGASILAGVGVAVALLGRALAMSGQGHTLTVITAVAAVHSGLGLLVNPLLGSLSDRLGRARLLAVTFGANALVLAMLVHASTVADYMLIMVVATVAGGKDALLPALVTDLVAPRELDRALSIMGAGRWIGNVIGFAVTGYAIHAVGLSWTFWSAAMLAAPTVLLMVQSRTGGKGEKPALPRIRYAR